MARKDGMKWNPIIFQRVETDWERERDASPITWSFYCFNARKSEIEWVFFFNSYAFFLDSKNVDQFIHWAFAGGDEILSLHITISIASSYSFSSWKLVHLSTGFWIDYFALKLPNFRARIETLFRHCIRLMDGDKQSEMLFIFKCVSLL